MNLPSTAIKRNDYTTLVAVWELRYGYQWELLSIVRLNRAITLTRESPITRLVFPTGVFPNRVWGGIYKHRATKTTPKKVDPLQERRHRVLQLLSKSPGQTREAIAPQLGVSVATAGQLLRHLENNGDIHYRPHPYQNRTRLYYAGKPPNTRGTSATRRTPPQLRREPPLTVDFVASKTLQPLNQ